MSAIDELAAEQKPVLDAISAAEQLGILFNLPTVGLKILGAKIFGQGSRATVEIEISNGETLVWDTLRDMTRPASLVAEIVACTGACPNLKQPQAVKAVALVRTLAEHEQAFTDNNIAVDWGISYLQAAETLDVDINDQRQRWEAFTRLAKYPAAEPTLGIVLRHVDDSRYVRSGWFLRYVKASDTTIGPAALAICMMRVGWIKRGKEGRIIARHPDFERSQSWNFWIVQKGWEDRWSGDD